LNVDPPVSLNTNVQPPGEWVTVPFTVGGVPVSPHVLDTRC
jgi:hypothetical protein